MMTDAQLQNAANWAQIIGLLGLPLTLITWFFTREHAVKFWKKWQKFIFSILAIVVLLVVREKGWLNWLSNRVPVWCLAIPLLIIGVLIWVLIRMAERSPESSQQISPPNLNDYTNDDIFGAHWIWAYRDDKIDARRVDAFCPRSDCRCRLEVKQNFQRASIRKPFIPISMVCPRCALTLEFDADLQRLIHDVCIEIERRINTGEFVSRVRKQT